MRTFDDEIDEDDGRDDDEDIPPSASAVDTDRLEAVTRAILSDFDLSPSERAEDAIASFYARDEEYRLSNRKPTVQERMSDSEARAYIRVKDAKMSARAKDMTFDAIRELACAVHFKIGRINEDCLSEFRMRLKGLLRRSCPAS